MKNRNYLIILAVILVPLTGSVGVLAQRAGMPIGLNRIEGRIIDESNLAVNNAYVELYNNYGSLVDRQRSAAQGRFSFRGMGPGRYTIKVKPFGTNLLEDSSDIEVDNSMMRSHTVMVDFRLRVDKRFRPDEVGVVGTIFAQEVPADARRLYTSGIEAIQSNPARAVTDLEAAIKLFPQYFNALAALGKAHIIKGKYDVGYPYLLRAIDVNRKCADCYYSLALAFYKLNEMPAATKAIDAATLLQPQVPTVRLLQGIIYRVNKDLVAAEKALLSAKSLFKEPNSEVHWQLSLVYNHLKRNKEAADELEKYLKTKPNIKDAEKESVSKLIVKLRTSG